LVVAVALGFGVGFGVGFGWGLQRDFLVTLVLLMPDRVLID
jgi:hypothetical protein